MEAIFENEHCFISFNLSLGTVLGDSKSLLEGSPSFYNKTKAKIKQAHIALQSQFSETTTLEQSINIISQYVKCKVHGL